MGKMVNIADVVKAARAEHDWICARGPSLQEDWIEFYLRVLRFKTTIVAGQPLWSYVRDDKGQPRYKQWKEFEHHICTVMQQKRASFYWSIRTVEELPPGVIRRLGKTKAGIAARLSRRGKLNPQVLTKIQQVSVEEASAIAARAIGDREGRIKFQLYLTENCHQLVSEELERARLLLGLTSREQAVEAVFANLRAMSDQELVTTLAGWEEVESKL